MGLWRKRITSAHTNWRLNFSSVRQITHTKLQSKEVLIIAKIHNQLLPILQFSQCSPQTENPGVIFEQKFHSVSSTDELELNETPEDEATEDPEYEYRLEEAEKEEEAEDEEECRDDRAVKVSSQYYCYLS